MPEPRTTAFRYLLAALAILGPAGTAFGQSGTFTFVSGDVSVERPDGRRIPVERNTPVRPGDAIVVGERSTAQLAMVDDAKLALRPNTRVQIERYAENPESDEGALLNVVRGTLRTFTGLIASRNRDRFLLKTKVATVGIRGSGNDLFAGKAIDCDPEKADLPGGDCDITVNHTIEGSHATTFGDFTGTGLPPQQGGAATLVSGPGQTVLVTERGEVTYIALPQFLADAATNPTNAERVMGGAIEGGLLVRSFGPVGSVEDGFLKPERRIAFVTDFGDLVATEPLGLQDIIFSGGATLFGQALGSQITREGENLRLYRMYAGLLANLVPSLGGGTAHDSQSHAAGGLDFTLGRWENASFTYFGAGPGDRVPGSIHWIVADSGFPAYLSDVLTGTATYTLVANTSPTNQYNTVGTLTSAGLNVNFSNRTLDAAFGVTMPAAGSNGGGSWQLAAVGVPIHFGTFYASTLGSLRITNGAGQDSAANSNLYGNLEGSFVGAGLQGAIMGYRFSDRTSSNSSNHNVVNGVMGLQGPAQNLFAPYRDGVVSDPANFLESALVRSFGTANRPEEVVADAAGRVSAFAAPWRVPGGHATYELGSSSIAQHGVDPQTGIVWGRWSSGSAQVSAGGVRESLGLGTASLHYVFSGLQSGPVSLPLTGSATYDLVGATSPTNANGDVGTLHSASLAANFTARTVDMGVNFTIAGQNVIGSAAGAPIYREQYFSAFRGDVPAGLPVPPQLLTITCQPACPNASGSMDGFFAGRSGQGAGMMYNLNGSSGAAAFRRGGG